MVHTEPFYSRKDDVPERPREFAGKVFRILHKDTLQVQWVGGGAPCMSVRESMGDVGISVRTEFHGPFYPNI